MNKPVNFGKLDREFVELYGNKFIFELIPKTDYEEIWIKEEVGSGGSPRQFGQYVLLLYLDFRHNTYSTRKCLFGMGYDGEDIDDDCTLPIHRCKTMETFKSFLSEIITNEIGKHTFLN